MIANTTAERRDIAQEQAWKDLLLKCIMERHGSIPTDRIKLYEACTEVMLVLVEAGKVKDGKFLIPVLTD